MQKVAVRVGPPPGQAAKQLSSQAKSHDTKTKHETVKKAKPNEGGGTECTDRRTDRRTDGRRRKKSHRHRQFKHMQTSTLPPSLSRLASLPGCLVSLI